MPFRTRFIAVLAALLFAVTGTAFAQNAALKFGKNNFDPEKPVEIVSDSFTVSDQDGSAVFDGHVVAGQGDMRLSADQIVVLYSDGTADEQSTISTMDARGNVTLVSGSDAAAARQAVYDLESSKVVMTGDVLLSSGKSTVSGGRLVINLKTGSAAIEGRVKTVFRPGKKSK